MKNTLNILFLCLLVTFSAMGQSDKKVLDGLLYLAVYEHKYWVDSTDVNFFHKGTIHLHIGKNHSRFVTLATVYLDSMPPNSSGQDIVNRIQSLPSLSPDHSQVLKNRANGTIQHHLMLDMSTFVFTQEPLKIFKWVIHSETMSFMGYTVQKATTTYGCRDWVAWFTPNIPIDEGPYKFNGLPGLIVKVHDTQGHYNWQLTNLLAAPKGGVVNETGRNSTLITREDLQRFRSKPSPFFPDRDPLRPVSNAMRKAQPNNPIELCAD